MDDLLILQPDEGSGVAIIGKEDYMHKVRND